MNRQDELHAIKVLFGECYELLQTKGADYAGELTAPAGGNFLALQELTGQSPRTVLWVLACKHLLAVIGHVSGRQLVAETLREHVRDLINYLALLLTMSVRDDTTTLDEVTSI